MLALFNKMNYSVDTGDFANLFTVLLGPCDVPLVQLTQKVHGR